MKIDMPLKKPNSKIWNYNKQDENTSQSTVYKRKEKKMCVYIYIYIYIYIYCYKCYKLEIY